MSDACERCECNPCVCEGLKEPLWIREYTAAILKLESARKHCRELEQQLANARRECKSLKAEVERLQEE